MSARPALGEDYGYCFRSRATEAAPAPSKWKQLRRAKELLPEVGRFQSCNDGLKRRSILGFPVPAKVSIHAKDGRAWFSGVMQCASVWVCPVCARRIAEERKRELQSAIDNAVAQGMGVSLITLTFPHGAGDVLSVIMEKFSKAQRTFKSGRAATRLREGIGYVGEIRTLEVTHGTNGWHPHAHSLWFTKKPLSTAEMEALRAELYQAWARACLKSGLPEPSAAHGVDVRGARYAGEYVAKWGFAAELASHTSKRGKTENSGRTPWQLLAGATEGHRRAAWLWREFALAFFGKRQLFWSRGLRKKFEIAPELTEQELLELQDGESEIVAEIDAATWGLIRVKHAQEYVLSLAVSSARDLYAYLNFLRSAVPHPLDGAILGPAEGWEW